VFTLPLAISDMRPYLSLILLANPASLPMSLKLKLSPRMSLALAN